MVKDKVFQMADGHSYYILEDVDYNGSKYALALECDLEKDEVNEEDYFAMEITLEDDELAIKHIEDDEVAKIVVTMLLQNMKNS